MPKFDKTRSDRLATCDARLQQLFWEVVKEFDCTILCGHRTEAEQKKAFDGGFSKVKFPNSKHNSYPSKAVDVAPFPINWNDTKRFKELADVVKTKARELGIKIKWGGDFKTLVDMPHFELDEE